jgi:hypothetical protein
VGVTQAGRTVSSKTVDSDDSTIESHFSFAICDPGTITFANMGTTPSITRAGTKYNFTSGSGSPAATGQITIPHRMGRAPYRVWLAADNATPGFYIVSVDATNIVIGVKNAPVASTLYGLRLLIE